MFYMYIVKDGNLKSMHKQNKVVIFRKGGARLGNLNFNFHGVSLEIVKSFFYLGVVFSQSGSFGDAQNNLASKAQKAIFKLNKYLYNFPNVTVKHRLDLFDKLIMPILNYSCEVWGFLSTIHVERVHTQHCKRILLVERCTQNDFVYGALGRLDLTYNIYVRIVKYWLKYYVPMN